MRHDASFFLGGDALRTPARLNPMSLESAVESAPVHSTSKPSRSWLGRTLAPLGLALGLGSAALAPSKVEAYAADAIPVSVGVYDAQQHPLTGVGVSFEPVPAVDASQYRLAFVRTPADSVLWVPPSTGILRADLPNHFGMADSAFSVPGTAQRMVVVLPAKDGVYRIDSDPAMARLKQAKITPTDWQGNITGQGVTILCLEQAHTFYCKFDNQYAPQFGAWTAQEKANVLGFLASQAAGFVAAGLPIPASSLYTENPNVDGDPYSGTTGIWIQKGPTFSNSAGGRFTANGRQYVGLGIVRLPQTAIDNGNPSGYAKETLRATGFGLVTYPSCLNLDPINPTDQDNQHMADIWGARLVLADQGVDGVTVLAPRMWSWTPNEHTIAVQEKSWSDVKGLYRP